MESKTNKKRVWRAPTDEDKKMDRCRARNSFEKRAFYVQWCEEWQNWALYSNSNILVRVDEVLSPADGAKEKTDTPYVIIKKERDQLIAQRDELLAATNNLLSVIDKAGLGNLSNGVQLGAMSWYVKASDAIEWAKEAIAKCEVKS